MTRDEAMAMVSDVAADREAFVFAGNGYTARSLAALARHGRTFPMVGSMGLAPAIAAGFAHGRDIKVVVVEGDGNALMGMSGFPVVARAAGGGFVHVVLDNGQYETTGGQRTLSSTADLGSVALASGYHKLLRPADGHALELALATGLGETGPVFVLVETEPGQDPVHGRVREHPRDIAARVRSATSAPHAA